MKSSRQCVLLVGMCGASCGGMFLFVTMFVCGVDPFAYFPLLNIPCSWLLEEAVRQNAIGRENMFAGVIVLFAWWMLLGGVMGICAYWLLKRIGNRFISTK